MPEHGLCDEPQARVDVDLLCPAVAAAPEPSAVSTASIAAAAEPTAAAAAVVAAATAKLAAVASPEGVRPQRPAHELLGQGRLRTAGGERSGGG